MKPNYTKIMQEGNMPWELTPFDRPSTYMPLYLYLARVCGYYCKNIDEKRVLTGAPAWFELVRFCGLHADAEYAGHILAYCSEDSPTGGGDEASALRFLVQLCQPFVNEFKKNLMSRLLTGQMVLEEKYYE
jgi:hypothetical protein